MRTINVTHPQLSSVTTSNVRRVSVSHVHNVSELSEGGTTLSRPHPELFKLISHLQKCGVLSSPLRFAVLLPTPDEKWRRLNSEYERRAGADGSPGSPPLAGKYKTNYVHGSRQEVSLHCGVIKITDILLSYQISLAHVYLASSHNAYLLLFQTAYADETGNSWNKPTYVIDSETRIYTRKGPLTSITGAGLFVVYVEGLPPGKHG
jgi:hypothetical protein